MDKWKNKNRHLSVWNVNNCGRLGLVWFVQHFFFFQIPGYLPWIEAYVVFILSLKWWFGEYIKKIHSWFSQLSKYFYRIDFFSIFYMTMLFKLWIHFYDSWSLFLLRFVTHIVLWYRYENTWRRLEIFLWGKKRIFNLKKKINRKERETYFVNRQHF